MTRKFKLAVKKFIEEYGLKIIRNSKNEKEAITNLMKEYAYHLHIEKLNHLM